ncbi:MAG: amidohydrolase [Hyphomonadaceae bacterium]
MKSFLSTCTAVCAALALSACATAPAGADPAPGFTAAGKSLREIYEHLHANPELSFQEKNSAAILAAEMRRLGFEVTTGIGDEWVKNLARERFGKVEDGVGGYGLVAVMKNGAGPTVLIRTDMDALPVTERTGLPYASKKTDIAWSGEEGGVMHACGHDIHMTAWVGTARELAARTSEWSGTLVMIAEPAEEIGLGARSLIENGLFENFPRPDYNLALHDSAGEPAGVIGTAPGYVMANVDSVDIFVKGRGGHGAYPQDTIDPIVVAARIVTTLQTLVSRELDPQDAAVVTVGAFNAGTKHNIIPDDVHLQLTVRSYADETRKKLHAGIERIARAEALAAGLDGDMAPKVVVTPEGTPSLYNTPSLTERLTPILAKVMGEDDLVRSEPSMGGEDFSRYGREEPRIPTMMFWVGAVSKATWEASRKPGGKPLPALHSSLFAPDPDPTLAAAVKAMTASAMELMKK